MINTKLFHLMMLMIFYSKSLRKLWIFRKAPINTGRVEGLGDWVGFPCI